MGAVEVDLDPGRRLTFGPRVAADVIAAFEHEHALAELVRQSLGHRQPEEPGTHHNRVVTHVSPFHDRARA